MKIHVALLRGVNVGGANRLPMAELQAMFEAAGAVRAATLIQSGNVVFQSAETTGEEIAAAVRAAIERACGFRAPIILRDADRWRALVAGNPFGADADALHVSCLSAAPSPAAIASLDPKRSPPDQFVVVGADVYLRLPNGVARSKLTNAWFDARLGVVSTMRNWRTVLTLAQMVEKL